MGVAGLWDLIQHTSETRSLTHLAVVDGFEKNASGLRGYRIGIDASIWFFHAKSSREGENPELRLIFFRLAKLLSEPFLPLFVFDGPKRPTWKRGIQISKKPHWMIHGVKTMINAFGFEWRQAPGEAEAELAYLNRVDVIDGILSDDVDNFLFGALTVIRNPGRGLTGNISNPALNAEGKDDGNHVRIFTAANMVSDETVALTRAGFILIGLLSGGDYEEKAVPGSKLNGCGIATAHALARCGFGEELVNALNVLPEDIFAEYLVQWRDALRVELRTNSHGYLPRKNARLANSVPDAFPNLKVLRAYVQPVTSESEARLAGISPPVPQIQWKHEHSLAALALFCEEKFEWGTVHIIPKRFRSLLWHGSVIRILRRATLDLDWGEGASWNNGRVRSTEKPLKDPNASAIPRTPTKNRKQAREAGLGTAIGTPSKMITKYFADISLRSPTTQRDPPDDQDAASADTEGEHPLISNISASTTTHPQTDFLLEYRVELDPYQLIQLTQSGIKGVRDEPVEASDIAEDGEVDGPKKQKPKPKAVDPFSLHRIWVPASMLQPVEKELVNAFEAQQDAKRKKKSRKAVSDDKRSAAAPDTAAKSAPISTAKSKPKPRKGASASARMRLKTTVSAVLSDDSAENFDLAAVSDASDSDASGSRSGSKPSTATIAAKKATMPGRALGRQIATDPEIESDRDGGEGSPFVVTFPQQKSIENPPPPKPRQMKAAGPLLSGPSTRHIPPADGQSKTSHCSLLKALDTEDWDDLFPPASKVPIPSNPLPLSPTRRHQPRGKSKASSAMEASSPPKRRRQVFTDAQEDSERDGSVKCSSPKSPRKSRNQVSPSPRREKITSPKVTRRGGLKPPVLSSSSESENDDILGSNARDYSRRAGSPRPRKGPAKDAFRALWHKLETRPVSGKPAGVIELSSEDEEGSDKGVALFKRFSPQPDANDRVATLPQKDSCAGTASRLTQQPRLPFRSVKTATSKTATTKIHPPKHSPPTQRNISPAAVLDVIDLTTP